MAKKNPDDALAGQLRKLLADAPEATVGELTAQLDDSTTEVDVTRVLDQYLVDEDGKVAHVGPGGGGGWVG